MTTLDTLRQAAAQFAAEAQTFGNPITCVLLVAVGDKIMQSISFPKDAAELGAAVIDLEGKVEAELPNLFPPPPKAEARRSATVAKNPRATDA